MNLLKKIRLLFISFTLSFSIAFGQNVNDWNLDINSPKQEKKLFPNAIKITRQQLFETFGNTNTQDPYGITSILSLQTGITFRCTGDPGAETWFIVRNFGRDNSRMTLVLLDGRPINLANNHTVEFDDIPVDIIESIIIYPGPVPVQYGGFQSVVEITTLKNVDIFSTDVSIADAGTYKLSVTYGTSGKFHYLMNFDFYRSNAQTDYFLDGIMSNYKYSNREVNTFVPTFKLGFEINKNLDLTLQGNFVDFKKMFGTKPLFDKESSRKRLMHNYSLLLQPSRGSEQNYQLIFFQNRESETLNPVFPEDSTYNVRWGKQKRTASGFNGYYKFNLIENKLALKGGGEALWTNGSTDDSYLYFKYINKQNFYGGFLQTEMSYWQGSFITIGARLDGQNGVKKPYLSPVGSISQSFLEDNINVFFSYGVQRRWIPLNEVNTFNRPDRIFGPPFLQGQIDLPSKTLNMETFKAFDAGINIKLWDGKLISRINYFNQTNEGHYAAPLFEIRPVKTGASVPPGFLAAIVASDRNYPGYDINQGAELSIQIKPINEINIFSNVTYFIESISKKYDNIELYDGPLSGPAAQASINNSIGKFVLPYNNKPVIPGAYKWLANLGASYNPDLKTVVSTILRYRGVTENPIMKFGLNPQTTTIPSNLTVDTFLSRDIVYANKYKMSVNFSVYNIFNKNYQTFVHYPMFGRYISFGVTASLL